MRSSHAEAAKLLFLAIQPKRKANPVTHCASQPHKRVSPISNINAMILLIPTHSRYFSSIIKPYSAYNELNETSAPHHSHRHLTA